MLRTSVAVAARLLDSRSFTSDGLAGLVGVLYRLMMLVVALTLPALLAIAPFGMEKELTKYSKAPENSFEVEAAKFYKAIIPQAAFDAYASLPAIKLTKDEPGFAPGGGIKNDFKNAKWGALAVYFVVAWLIFASQVVIFLGFMFVLSRIWAPLGWASLLLFIVHLAMPLVLMQHFKYMQ